MGTRVYMACGCPGSCQDAAGGSGRVLPRPRSFPRLAGAPALPGGTAGLSTQSSHLPAPRSWHILSKGVTEQQWPGQFSSF